MSAPAVLLHRPSLSSMGMSKEVWDPRHRCFLAGRPWRSRARPADGRRRASLALSCRLHALRRCHPCLGHGDGDRPDRWKGHVEQLGERLPVFRGSHPLAGADRRAGSACHVLCAAPDRRSPPHPAAASLRASIVTLTRTASGLMLRSMTACPRVVRVGPQTRLLWGRLDGLRSSCSRVGSTADRSGHHVRTGRSTNGLTCRCPAH
jgi:hypothetical protein